MTLAGPTDTCKCGTAFIWAKVGACGGRAMPVDPEPVANGNIIDTGDVCVGGAHVVRVLTKEQREQPRGMFDEPRYVSHFATCPNGDEFQRSRAPKGRRPPSERGRGDTRDTPDPTRPLEDNTHVVGRNHPEQAQAMERRSFPRSGSFRWSMGRHFAGLADIGSTDDELEIYYNRSHQSASGCRSTLTKDGWLIEAYDDGVARPHERINPANRRRERMNRHGNWVGVYVAAPALIERFAHLSTGDTDDG